MLKVTKVPSYGIVLIKVIANKTLISARVKDSIMYMNRTEQKNSDAKKILDEVDPGRRVRQLAK